jgi:hypothetical protein
METSNPLHALVTLFVMIAVYCAVMPTLGGFLLFKGVQRCRLEELPLSKCINVFFVAAGAAYMLMVALSRLMPLGEDVGIIVAFSVVVSVEMGIIAVLVRRFTAGILLIEAGAVLLTNLAGYTLASCM